VLSAQLQTGLAEMKKEMQCAEDKRAQVEAQMLQRLEISKKEHEEKRMHTEMQLLQTISENTRILEEKRIQTELHMLQKIEENNRKMEERHAQTVRQVWEIMESDKAEMTQKVQEGNQILTQNLMKMCEDLAARVTSPGGGGGEGTGMSPMQERKFEKMLETHASGWELRTTTFLEKKWPKHM
jgi:hypothetical protein